MRIPSTDDEDEPGDGQDQDGQVADRLGRRRGRVENRRALGQENSPRSLLSFPAGSVRGGDSIRAECRPATKRLAAPARRSTTPAASRVPRWWNTAGKCSPRRMISSSFADDNFWEEFSDGIRRPKRRPAAHAPHRRPVRRSPRMTHLRAIISPLIQIIPGPDTTSLPTRRPLAMPLPLSEAGPSPSCSGAKCTNTTPDRPSDED